MLLKRLLEDIDREELFALQQRLIDDIPANWNIEAVLNGSEQYSLELVNPVGIKKWQVRPSVSKEHVLVLSHNGTHWSRISYEMISRLANLDTAQGWPQSK